MDFLIDDYLKYNLAFPIKQYDFAYDNLEQQKVYNKSFFSNLTSNNPSNAYPYFIPASSDETKPNTASNYIKFVTQIKNNQSIEQKPVGNNQLLL